MKTIIFLTILTTLFTSCSKVTLFSEIGVGNVTSTSLTLRWDAPTQNTDDTPISDLASYKLYYGTASGTYTSTLNVGLVNEYTVTNLMPGATYYFAVSALNTSGAESDRSSEFSYLAQ